MRRAIPLKGDFMHRPCWSSPLPRGLWSASLSRRLRLRDVNLFEVIPLKFHHPEGHLPTASQAVTYRLRSMAWLCPGVFHMEEQSVDEEVPRFWSLCSHALSFASESSGRWPCPQSRTWDFMEKRASIKPGWAQSRIAHPYFLELPFHSSRLCLSAERPDSGVQKLCYCPSLILKEPHTLLVNRVGLPALI